MHENIIASIAVFRSLYDTNQDIYSVLARFVTATINQQNLRSFDVTTLRNQLKECFGIEVYDSVLKTIIRQRLKNFVTKSDSGEYQATPSTDDFEEFERQLSEQAKKYRLVFDAVIAYYRDLTAQSISDQDIIDSFTTFLLTDPSQDYEHIFSRFMLSKENDEQFITCLNEVKEGAVIMTGLKDIANSADVNTIGSWSDKLTIYLDTEELFSAYGYNGELFRQILGDFIALVQEANKRTRHIELKFLDETKNVIDGYFTQAERILEGRSQPNGGIAMTNILSKCRYKSDIRIEKAKFYTFLANINIEYDERSSYVGDMSGNLQTTENLEAIKGDLTTLTMSDDDILKYLRIFSIINHNRHSESKTSFEKCRCVLLSESCIPRFISWHSSIHKDSTFTYSTTMDYAVSRLWFRLHKGLMGRHIPASMDVMNRVKIVIASLVDQSVLQKYNELKSTQSTTEEKIEIYKELRAYEVYPETITAENVEDLIDFTKIPDVETLRRERTLLQKQASEGKQAILQLKQIKQEKRKEAKQKIAQQMRNCAWLLNTMAGALGIVAGVVVYFALAKLIFPQDTSLSIVSLILSCIPIAVIYKKYTSYRNCKIRKKARRWIKTYLAPTE